MSLFKRIAFFIAGKPIVDPKTGAPTAEFLRALNNQLDNIRVSGSQLEQMVEDIVATLEQANIALTTAEAAAEALEAQAASLALNNSYTDPVSILTAEVDPADATKAKITIAAHSRIYSNGTTKAVNGGSQAGLLQSTTYSIYYMDPTYAGGAVTYQFTTDYTQAVQGNGKHYCGYITTPGSGGPPVDGYTPPPYGFDDYPAF